jgi:hypothetical protein
MLIGERELPLRAVRTVARPALGRNYVERAKELRRRISVVSPERASRTASTSHNFLASWRLFTVPNKAGGQIRSQYMAPNSGEFDIADFAC